MKDTKDKKPTFYIAGKITRLLSYYDITFDKNTGFFCNFTKIIHKRLLIF